MRNMCFLLLVPEIDPGARRLLSGAKQQDRNCLRAQQTVYRRVHLLEILCLNARHQSEAA